MRKACDSYYDLYIDFITTRNGSTHVEKNDIYCDACFRRMTAAQILAEVTRKMLIMNPMGFPPHKTGECEANWRVVKGPCWQKLFIDSDGQANDGVGYQFNRVHWCETNEECCVDYFQVCIDSNGDRKITRQPPAKVNPPMLPCPSLRPGVVCEPSCGIAPFGPGEP